MPTISFATPKGGAGKTTTALTLAAELSRGGDRITLIDADPNQPLVRWSALPGKPDNIEVLSAQSEETILDRIEEAAARSKVVIVDLEGTASSLVSFAVGASDLVVIPCQGSMLDAPETAKAIKLVTQTARSIRRTIDYAVVFTKIPAAIATKNYKDINGQFENAGINVLPVQMIEREAFRTIFATGGTIYDLPASAVGGLEAARENSFALADCVLKRLTQMARVA